MIHGRCFAWEVGAAVMSSVYQGREGQQVWGEFLLLSLRWSNNDRPMLLIILNSTMNAKLVCECLDNAICFDIRFAWLVVVLNVLFFSRGGLRVADRLCLRVPELSRGHQTLSGTQLTPTEFTKGTTSCILKHAVLHSIQRGILQQYDINVHVIINLLYRKCQLDANQACSLWKDKFKDCTVIQIMRIA